MHPAGLALSSFDMFHVGHLSALRQANELTERLVIAVASDDLVITRYGRSARVSQDERVEVLGAFHPEATIEVVDNDSALVLSTRFGLDVIFVCGPVAEPAVASPSGLTVVPLRYEMTSSASLLKSLESDVLWLPGAA